MSLVIFNYVVFLTILNVCDCSRRIVQGDVVTEQKKYVIYLLKADIDPQTYDAWLCGGALVSPTFILTSAACVEDVKHLYAIAGYDKYKRKEDLANNDECIQKSKKKVVYTCVPKSYELDYERLDKWAYIDIALVKVESPYSAKDVLPCCSYVPEWIQINYESKYQEPGTDAIVFGWGHTELWRKTNDTQNYNQNILRYASTMIQDKKECKKYYQAYANMSLLIDNYMICTFNKGNLDLNGELIVRSAGNATGCGPRMRARVLDRTDADPKGQQSVICEEIPVNSEAPNGNYDIPATVHNEDNSDVPLKEAVFVQRTTDTKSGSNAYTPGICQNDHGGPLVTWVGAHEVIIGVASVFKVDKDYKCMGPYLFTSTQCNGAFLSCILESNNFTQNTPRTGKYRRELCDSPPQLRGYSTVERHISWINHPDGPADNEKYAMRPQRPIWP